MAQHQDVLSQSTRELLPVMTDNLSKFYPGVDLFLKGPNVDLKAAKGPYREFSMWNKGPGNARHIKDGSESYGGTRAQISQQGKVEAARIVYAWDVPAKDVAEANADPAAAKKYVKRYSEAAMRDFLELIEKQVLMGNQSTDACGALWTLNGDVTGNPLTGMADGWLGFAAKASQTGLVGNIRKEGHASGITEWYNQWPAAGQINSWSDHGYKRVKNAYNQASLRAPGSKYCMISDLASFEQYEDGLLDQRRYVDVKLAGEEGAVARSGLRFGDRAVWYPSVLLDDTDSNFTTVSSQGILYGICEDHVYAFTLQADESPVSGGADDKYGFCMREPTKIPRQDAFEYELIIHIGAYTDRLNVHFAAAGTSNV